MDERPMKSSLTTKNRMCNILSSHESLYLSRWDVKKYLANYPDVTKEEKKELLAWIKAGHSPYYNDRYCYDASDRLLDFIGAIRAENEYWEEQRQLHQGIEQ